MNDDEDDFPDFVVGSGTEHHVSVSEVTGNAKNPKNVVVSHPEEIAERKSGLEHLNDASKAAKPVQGEDAGVNNHDKLLADGAKDANVQHVPTQAPAANVQAVPNGPSAADNLQSIKTDVSASNRQAVPPSTPSGSNVQAIGSDAIGDNRQALNTPGAPGANVQNIKTDEAANNRQAVPPSAPTLPNVQAVGSAAAADNRQALKTTPDTAPNQQSIPSDDASANRQGIATDQPKDNRQALGDTNTASNRQPALTASGRPNEHDIPTLVIDPNLQSVKSASAMPDNRQAIGGDEPALNRQSAPEDGSGNNRQAIGTQALSDHREALPSGSTVRAKVDFPTGHDDSASASNVHPTSEHGQATGQPSVATADQAKPLTPSEHEKLKHDDASALFHRRLVGIKHDVDDLNHRLTDFEQKSP